MDGGMKKGARKDFFVALCGSVGRDDGFAVHQIDFLLDIFSTTKVYFLSLFDWSIQKSFDAGWRQGKARPLCLHHTTVFGRAR